VIILPVAADSKRAAHGSRLGGLAATVFIDEKYRTLANHAAPICEGSELP